MTLKCLTGVLWLGLWFWSVSEAEAATAKWRTLRDCVLVENPSNDGDSFHIRHGRRDYYIRLYFVDAPETDMRFPDRVREQAEAFGTTTDVALRYAALAKETVAGLLGKPFTVYTKLIDARGASRTPRYYAMVSVDDVFLCETLVARGLVRIHGYRSALPDGTASRDHIKKLQSLEGDAKRRKVGVWNGR